RRRVIIFHQRLRAGEDDLFARPAIAVVGEPRIVADDEQLNTFEAGTIPKLQQTVKPFAAKAGADEDDHARVRRNFQRLPELPPLVLASPRVKTLEIDPVVKHDDLAVGNMV